MSAPRQLIFTVVPDIPLIVSGDDLGGVIIDAMIKSRATLNHGDIIVVAQKVVSKAQGRFVNLDTVEPSTRAQEIAAQVNKDPRLVEVILSEAVRLVRLHPSVFIVEHHTGHVAANAGVDQSNVSASPNGNVVLLLPEDPDAAAAQLRTQFERRFAKRIGVIINDSFGRPWRQGTVGVALGASGIPSLNNLRGRPDLFGRPLEVTETAFADEVASAASLLMGQSSEAYPVVVVSGFAVDDRDLPAKALIRPADQDLFR